MYERQNLMATFFKSSKVSLGVFSASLYSLKTLPLTSSCVVQCSSATLFSLESTWATARKRFMEKWVFKVFPVLSCQGHLLPVAKSSQVNCSLYFELLGRSLT